MLKESSTGFIRGGKSMPFSVTHPRTKSSLAASARRSARVTCEFWGRFIPTESPPTRGFDLRTPTESPPTRGFNLRTPTESSPTRGFDLRTPTESPPTRGFDLRTPTESPPTRGFDLRTPTESPPTRLYHLGQRAVTAKVLLAIV